MIRCSVGGTKWGSGSSGSFSIVRSWDGLISIPVVDGADWHSHEAEGGSEDDSEDDDLEEDSDYE